MVSFDIAYKNTGGFEGGYVSPEIAASINDSGGETYKGISRKNNPSWKGWGIIDVYKSQNSSWQYYNKTRYYGLKHGFVIPNDTLDQLHHDYIKANYWSKLHLDQFKNQSLANYVYDISVNSGPGTAAKSLQTVIAVAVNGVIGSETIKKLNTLNQSLVFNKLKEYRKQWLEDRKNKLPAYRPLLARSEAFFFQRSVGVGILFLGVTLAIWAGSKESKS
jgi:lysozyme family protein